MPLQIIRQDITKMKVDAIVNTTNEEMVGYSGIDEAIHSAAGELLDKECEKIRPLFLGEAKVTKGYNLSCKYIIHTSGPIWCGGNHHEKEILENCYKVSLKAALEYGCETVAFPLISSGVYCYPKDQVLKIAVSVITEFLFEHELTVYLCVFDKTSYSFSKKLFSDIREFIDDEYAQSYDDENFFKSERTLLPSASERIVRNVCMESVQENTSASDAESRGSVKNKTLQEYMKAMDKPFAYKLFDLIEFDQMLLGV